MDTKKLKNVIRVVNKAVEDISNEELKKIAFQIVLNKLINESDGIIGRSAVKETKSKQGSSSLKMQTKDEKININDLMKKINRTEYSEIRDLKSVKDRALYILKIAKNDFKEEWLTSPQISAIISEKFNIKSSRQSVNSILKKEMELVDSKKLQIKGGLSYAYRIMQKGEAYVEKIMKELGSNKNEE